MLEPQWKVNPTLRFATPSSISCCYSIGSFTVLGCRKPTLIWFLLPLEFDTSTNDFQKEVQKKQKGRHFNFLLPRMEKKKKN
jgi:hypothetical protein